MVEGRGIVGWLKLKVDTGNLAQPSMTTTFFKKYVSHELGHPDWIFHYNTSGLVAIGM